MGDDPRLPTSQQEQTDEEQKEYKEYAIQVYKAAREEKWNDDIEIDVSDDELLERHLQRIAEEENLDENTLRGTVLTVIGPHITEPPEES